MIPKRLWPVGIAAFVALSMMASVRTQAEPGGQSQDAQGQTEATTKIEKPAKSSKSKREKRDKRDAKQEAAASLPAVLMDESRDPATLNLYYGAGGQEDAPNPNDVYTFVAEDLNQTQPKFDARDSKGRLWRIKLGAESKPETAAARLVWAAGYYVDEDYYLSEVRVQGMHRLQRGQRYVKKGVVQGARLRLQPKSKNIAYWKWSDNPFVGTRELDGLWVVMALLNNWDLRTLNNKTYVRDGERRLVVSDLGATFGISGNELTRRKSNLAAYTRSKFIAKVSPDTVAFALHTKPWLVAAFFLQTFFHLQHYYSEMSTAQKSVRDIPRSDAQWIGERMSRLSDDQIRDSFRASDYSPQQIDGFTKVVRQRITELVDLGGES